MSVNFGKLNRPGLSASFGHRKTTGTASQAARNLSNSSPATRSTSFSFRASNRYNWVGGENVTKGGTRYNYQSARAALNSGGMIRSPYIPNYGVNYPNNGMMSINGNNSYMKGYAIGQTLLGGMSLLDKMGVFNGLKSKIKGIMPGDGKNNNVENQTNGQKLEQAFSSTGVNNTVSTSNSNVAGAISDINSATNSVDLRDSIVNAKAEYASLQTQTDALKASAEKAEAQKDNLKGEVKDKKDAVTQAKQDFSEKKTTVKAKENIRDTKKLALQNANSAYAKALDSYNIASSAYDSAVANTQSMKTLMDTIPKMVNGLPNPLYENAKIAYDNAVKAEAKALENKNNAEVAKNKAYSEVGSAKEAVDKAEAELDRANSELDTAKEAASKAEENLKQKEEELRQATENLEKAENDISKYEQHKSDLKHLKDAIDNANTKLQKLEKEEVDKFKKLDTNVTDSLDKNATRSGKIDGDVDTRSERRMSKKIGKTNDNISENMQTRDKYSVYKSETEYIQEKLKFATNDTYTQITTPSGKTLYYKGRELITEQDFLNSSQNS